MSSIRPVTPEQDSDKVVIDSYMEEAFNDKNINSYQNGPGAALSDARNNQSKLILCIKGVPSYLCAKSLQRILSNKGNVIAVHAPKSENCSYYFAECETENDFEAILIGMQNNIFNMRVEPKKPKKAQNDRDEVIKEIKETVPSQSKLENNTIDMSNRRLKSVYSNIQHPKLGKENNNITNQEYGFENMHLLTIDKKQDEKEFRLNIIKKKAETCEGGYDSTKGAYIKTCEGISLSQFKFSPCRICNNLSNKICEKSNEFFCSVDCQMQYIKSLTEKKLETPSPIIHQIIKDEVPKSGDIVIITHVEQTNMVFVRSYEKNTDYVKVINEVEKYSENAKFLQKLPKVDEYVVANYKGIWCRGIVLNNQIPDKIKIAYIDFGNWENKKLSELKEMVPECYSLKCYPFIIYLKNVEKYVCNDDFINFMTPIVESDVQLKIRYKKDDIKENKIVAELFNSETNENINIKCINLLIPAIPKDADKPIMYEDVKQKDLPVGENIPIIITCDSNLEFGNISCIPSCEVHELDDLNDLIKKYAELKDDFYTPRNGEMCVAKCENAWYRACCCEVVGDRYPCLLFIDYGNISPIPIQNIRKYPKEITLPCKTDECTISGLNNLTDTNCSVQLATRLRQLLPLYEEITVPKIERIDNTTILYFTNIIDILKMEGLLKN